MKLLFVIDTLNSGGSQRQMVSLAIGLKKRGHTIEFLIYHSELDFFFPRLKCENIPVHTVSKAKYSIKIISTIKKLVKSCNFDGVLSFLTAPNIYAELALAGKKQPFLVVSERNFLPKETSIVIKWAINRLHYLADHVTVNSHHQRISIQRKNPKLSARISTIYNGVDLTVFQPQQSLEATNFNDVQQFLVLGSIVPRKNMINLIKALAVYRERYDKVPFKINWAGRRNPADHGKIAFKEASLLIDKLKLDNNWQWLGEQSDVVRLLNTHDALIHPGVREGLPNGICEALACGRPVLAGNILDHPRLVEHGIRGLLFDPYHPKDIAEKLYQFCQLSNDGRHKMGVEARAYAIQNLSLEKMTHEYESLFTNLIATNKT